MSEVWRGGDDSTKDRRPRLKELAAASAQEQRRQDFLRKQRQARRNLSDHARLLATLPVDDVDTDCQPSFPAGADDAEMAIADEAVGVGCDGEGATIEEAVAGAGRNRDKYRRGKGRWKSGSSAGKPGGSYTKRRDRWASQFCTPEWMLTVPPDLNGAGSPLGAGWYVMTRPEGKRVLVIAANGETVARQMSGAITHRFSSHLPGGSTAGRRGGAKGGGYCILDCVFHELDETFFVLDMMAWKGYPLYDCTTDFRFYWIRTKLLEANGPLETVGPGNAYRIKPTPYQECDRQGLAHAYSSPVPFIKDGLLFYMKRAHYQLGPTPLVLLWKNSQVTRYLGTDGPQAVVLRVGRSHSSTVAFSESDEENSRGTGADSGKYSRECPVTIHDDEESELMVDSCGRRRSDGGEGRRSLPLLTSDGVCLGEIGDEGSTTYVPHAKPGELLRFTLTDAREYPDERLVEGTVEPGDGSYPAPEGRQVVGLRFEKRCSNLRPTADTWSKVLFRSRLRRNAAITIDDIDGQANVDKPRTSSGAASTRRAAEQCALYSEERLSDDSGDLL